jgi:serine/threonine-protein kinase
MLDLKASRFHQAALQSGLIDEAGLAACFDLIPPEKRTADAIDRRLARQAIATGRLTLWQAQQILSGRSTGYKIDKYVLLDLLGRGGMGRVYLAKDVRLNRMVALKILSAERMNNPRAIARFQREAKVGAQLQQENLVRVYDEGDAGGVRYLVMEYIEGKNVGQLIGELGSIPWPTAARLCRQIALGLEHARLKELIHRDVNPCNILVTQDGVAKLTDLGLAIDLNDQENVTRDGATVGTFDYISPEQARHSRSVDTRADIYSLGCTLYHMIAGRVPFPVASLPEKLYAHQLHEPDPLTEVAPGTPEGLAEVVRKMMKKRLEERYQTPLEVAQALEPYAVEAGWTTTRAASAPAALGASSPDPAGVVIEAPSSWTAPHNLETGLGSGAGSNPEGTGSGTAGSATAGRAAAGAGAGVGESFFPVDLGRDEPLFEGLNPPAKPKSKPKARRKPEPPAKVASKLVGAGAETAAGMGRRLRLLFASKRAALVAISVLGVAVAAGVVVLLATMAQSGPGFSGKAGQSGGEPAKPNVAKERVRGDIVLVQRDGSSEAKNSLAEALGLASSRAGAEVVLGAGATVRIDNAKTIRVSGGALTLRAAEGTRPVLEVKVKGPRPTFLVDANLRLEGLTVVVQYETATDSPIFQAERELTMSRCTFRADGPTEGSRLVLAEGRKATVDGCLFEGFETAVHFEANPGMAVAIKRSIFLSARPAEEAIGRAIRFRSIYGQGVGARLSVENCSTRSGVFLEVGNFGPATPLEVETTSSAFLVKSLLAVEGDAKAPLGAEASIRWKGHDNRFKVIGPTWASFADAPGGLGAWAKLASESGGKVQELKLAKEPPDPTSPKDCALLDEADKPVGADPATVGPN